MIKKILLALILAVSLVGCDSKTDEEDVVILLKPDKETQEQVQDESKYEIAVSIVDSIEPVDDMYIDITEPIIHLGDIDVKVGGTFDSLLNSGFVLDDDEDIDGVLEPGGYDNLRLDLVDDENFPNDLIINAGIINNTTDKLPYEQCNLISFNISSSYAGFEGEGVTEADTVFNLGQEIEAGFSNVRYGVGDLTLCLLLISRMEEFVVYI